MSPLAGIPNLTTAIEHLRSTLRGALKAASFDLGRTIISYRGGSTTTYGECVDDIISPGDLREIYERATWHDELWPKARMARVRIPAVLKADLADSLRAVLGAYVDPASDCVGHALPVPGSRRGASRALPNDLFVQAAVSSIGRFSEALTKDAAILGVDHVANLLADWIRGEPLRYRTCRVAALSLDRPLSPICGIDIIPLPLSSDALPRGLPSRSGILPEAYLGQSVVQVESHATPALFHPDVPDLGRVVTGKLSPGVSFDTIWAALSLECDAHIAQGFGWSDHGDLSAIATDGMTSGRPSYLSFSGQRLTMEETGITSLERSGGAVRSPSETKIADLLSALEKTDARTRLATARWKKSMLPLGDLPDRFIDLRIALEALMLPDGTNQQLSYTVAVRGAWFMGEDAATRRKAWKTLRDAYGVASNLVHGGKVKPGYEDLLEDARRLCRKGILRILEEGQVRDWDGLILDAPDE